MNENVTLKSPSVNLIIGTNHSGKTTLVKKIINDDFKANGRRVLIVLYDDLEFDGFNWVEPEFLEKLNFQGARKVIFYRGLLRNIIENFNDGLIIFHDCALFFRNNSNIPDLHSLLIRCRQKMIDMVAVGHAFSELPPKLFIFTTQFTLFRTIGNIKKRRKVIQNFEELKAAQLRINEKARTQPHYFETLFPHN